MKQLIWIFLLFLNALIGNAQNNKSVIKGTITDQDTKKGILNVKVFLFINGSTLVAKDSTTVDGNYKFSNLSSGSYTLAVYKKEYSLPPQKAVIITIDTLAVIDVILKANGALTEMKGVITDSKTKVTVSEIKAYAPNGFFNFSSGNSYAFKGNGDFNTESYSKVEDNEFKEVIKNPLSTFSIDVDRASYSNIRRHIVKGELPPIDAVRIEEMINYFTYDYPKPKKDEPFSITTEFTDCPWNKSHKLVHVGIKGKEIIMSNAPSNNLVFLIDVSGSMFSSDKLDLLKSGLYLLVDQLREKDKVAIVVYAGAAGLVLPSTSGKDKDKIKSIIEQLKAGGGTAGGEGIELAYKVAKENFIQGGNNRVILATDGDFNIGVSSEGELIRLIEKKREENIFLSVLGFGSGNLKDSKMEMLADKGNGNYNYIDNVLEAKKVLVTELGGTLVVIAKDVKIQTEFNPKLVKAYRLIGYANRQLANEDFNNDKKDAGELGSGHTVTVLYEIIPAGSKETIANVDSLKYQNNANSIGNNNFEKEVLTIKFRYKKPDDSVSTLITNILNDNNIPLDKASNSCQFAASVAEFGMLLSESKFKGDATYESVVLLAKSSKGKDDEGYRAEFIRLVEMAALLKKQ